MCSIGARHLAGNNMLSYEEIKMKATNEISILRIKDVVKKTGLSRSTLYTMMQPSSIYRDIMPPKIWLFGTPGKGPVGYLESDVDAFILALAAKSEVIHDRTQAQQEMEVAA